jgi:hypothetical protein
MDKKEPYWVLRTNRLEGDNIDVLGMFSQPNVLFTPILKKNIIKRLNSEVSIFDFKYIPQRNDLLKLCGEFDEYYCEFTDNKWVWLENFEFIEKKSGNFKLKRKGYIEGSKLMVLLDEYKELTNTQLYRNDDFNGFIDLENNFEEYLFDSKQWNENELIKLIEVEIRRLK